MSSACGEFVRAAGRTGRIVAEGNGPVVVIVGSMLVRAESYDTTRRALAGRGYQAIVVEAPGCGRSESVGAGWEFADYAAWVGTVLETRRLLGVTLVTHSNSGPVGMMLAVRRPDLVGRLVLEGSVGANRWWPLAGVIVGRAEDAFIELGLSAKKWHHVVLNVVRHWRNFWHQVAVSAGSDVTAVARDVRVPTLLAWGRHDHTMPLRCMRRLRRVLPAARAYVSQEGSHDWMVDRAEEFAGAIDAFVRETSGSATDDGAGVAAGVRPDVLKGPR